MTNEIFSLLIAAATIGFVHTLLGPDHYLPFVAMARARDWSPLKTSVITAICGVGHVASSVVLGFIGIALGLAVTSLEAVESYRGDLAAWALIAFGLVYTVWGVRHAMWKHHHIGPDGAVHSHHSHGRTKNRSNITPWVLFTVFVLGPCEPLIPILMYPAAHASTSGLILVTVAFSLVTIATMVTMVWALHRGISFVPVHRLERFAHAIAGMVVLGCGLAVRFGL